MMALSWSLAVAEFISLLLFASSVRAQLCGEVRGAIYTHFQIADDFYDKPRAVSAYSACHGMQVTCCSPKVEKEIIPSVQRSFLTELQSVLDDVFGTTCNRIGRHFSRGLFETLSEAKEILTKEVRGALRVESDDQWQPFDQLFDFLQGFPYTQNFHVLNRTTYGAIKELVTFAIANHKEHQKINNTRLANYFSSLWSKKMDKSLLGYLYYLRNMEQALRAANVVLQQTRQHEFLSMTPCTNAIMRMYPCGLCSGHITTTPCDGSCINTMRGCFADVAEMQPLLKDFSDQLRKFAMLSMSEFHPVSFVEGALMDYVWLARHIEDSDLMKISQEDTTLPTEATSGSPLPVRQARLSFSRPHDYRNHLHDAFNRELECMATTAESLLEIPEKMCGINPKHLNYIRNIDCWNGTAQGSYKGALVGHTIKDQLNNPSFTKEEQQIMGHHSLQYWPQISELNDSLTEINKYIRLYDCLVSNDEDCGVTVHSVCSHEEIEEPSNIIPTNRPLPTDIEPTEDLVSGSGYPDANHAYSSGDGDNEVASIPTMAEEFETYDPVTQICEHVFVVKMIPPFIRDVRNDIHSPDKPTRISPTRNQVVPTIKGLISPSISTKHASVEPSNRNIPEYSSENTASSSDNEDNGTNKEEDNFIQDNSVDSEFLLSNPSGSSSCFVSATVSLILLSITSCVVLQLLAF